MSWGSEKCIHPEFQKVSIMGLRRGDLFLQSWFDANAFLGQLWFWISCVSLVL